MHEKIDFETNSLIIGGGPAGSTLARKLSKNSIENILIEKNRSYDKPCGGGVKSIVFKEFDISKSIESKKITSFTLYSKKNKVSIDLIKTPISIVLRKEFDEKNRILAQESGTEILEGRYLNSIQYDKYVISTILLKNNKKITIKSDYLIGADGVRSTVRKKVFNSYQNSLLTNYSLLKTSNLDDCKFYFSKEFSPNEYTWIFPHGDKVSVGSILKSNNNSKTLFKKFIEKHKDYNNEKINGFYIPVWKKNDIFYKKRVFLLGDAAGQVLPFTYEGIYYVMKSANILADAIIENRPENYELEWKKTYQKRFNFFQKVQKLFLSCDLMSNIMLKFFQRKRLQQSALKYWEGTKTLPSIRHIFFKTIKYTFGK